MLLPQLAEGSGWLAFFSNWVLTKVCILVFLDISCCTLHKNTAQCKHNFCMHSKNSSCDLLYFNTHYIGWVVWIWACTVSEVCLYCSCLNNIFSLPCNSSKVESYRESQIDEANTGLALWACTCGEPPLQQSHQQHKVPALLFSSGSEVGFRDLFN